MSSVTQLYPVASHKVYSDVSDAFSDTFSSNAVSEPPIKTLHHGVHESVLLICAENSARATMRNFLETEQFRVTETTWGEQAVSLVNADTSVIVLDASEFDIQADMFCRHIAERFPDMPIIILDDPTNDPARKRGLVQMAFSYITKPCDRQRLISGLRHATRFSKLSKENKVYKQSVGCPLLPVVLSGNSHALQTLRKQIETFGRLDNSLFITGERGTGKSVIAQLIHQCSARAKYPFIPISCDSISSSSLEADLFGFVKGAIPGISGERFGKLKLANRGTIFLDRIEALSPTLQSKLLSYLQEKMFHRIGAPEMSAADTRIIAATSCSLPIACAQGRFREDLYFRLNALTLSVPSLRDRVEDIPTLAREIIGQLATQQQENLSILSSNALSKMRQYSWPGNVRELEAVLQKAIAIAKDTIIGEDDISFDTINTETMSTEGSMGLAGLTMCEIERRAIIETINACSGNRAQSARKLGLSEKTIYNKIRQFKLRGIV